MSDPEFPPLLKGHDVEPPTSPFDTACEGARNRKLGAGDTVWSKDKSNVSLAIVLEPEIILENAVQMIPLAVVACGDCIGALAPPQIAVTYRWPSDILVNAGKTGEIRAASGDAYASDEVPNWMVIGIDLRLSNEPGAPEPGHQSDVTTLEEEGCSRISHTQFIESFSRHFLAWLNIWESDGFKPVSNAWAFRAEGREHPLVLNHAGEHHEGTFHSLDENGNILLKTAQNNIQTLQLLKMLEQFR